MKKIKAENILKEKKLHQKKLAERFLRAGSVNKKRKLNKLKRFKSNQKIVSLKFPKKHIIRNIKKIPKMPLQIVNKDLINDF